MSSSSESELKLASFHYVPKWSWNRGCTRHFPKLSLLTKSHKNRDRSRDNLEFKTKKFYDFRINNNTWKCHPQTPLPSPALGPTLRTSEKVEKQRGAGRTMCKEIAIGVRGHSATIWVVQWDYLFDITIREHYIQLITLTISVPTSARSSFLTRRSKPLHLTPCKICNIRGNQWRH